MTSLRKFSIVLLVVAALTGLVVAPAQAALSLNCNSTTVTVSLPGTVSCGASGGTAPYGFSIVSGSVPQGMSSIAGATEYVITGTPSFTGSYTFTVNVTDSGGSTPLQQPVTINVVTNGGTGTGGGSLVLSSVLPNTMSVGTGQNITVFGSGFTSTSAIVFNGVSLATTFQGTTQLAAFVQSAQVITGTLPVYVHDNATGFSSGTQYVTVTGTGGTGGLSLTQLSPSSAAVGSAGFTLTLYGSGFSNGSLVSFGNLFTTNGSVQSSGVMTVFIPSQYLTTAQTVNVSVGGSNAVPFTIGSGSGGSTGTLSITCNPTSGPTTLGTFFSQICSVSNGNGAYTWTISGLPSGLVQVGQSGTSVQINGTPTVSQSYNYTLQVTDTASHVGTINFTGTLGTGGNSGYNVTSVSPSSIGVGSGQITLSVFGNGFSGLSSVYFNGSPLPTQFVSVSQLNATLNSIYLTNPQTATVSVITSGSSTNSVPFTVGNGSSSGVVLSSLQPSSTPAGSAGFTLNLYGSGFSQSSLVSFGSNTFTGTFVNSGNVQVFIPSQYLTTSQTINVSVGGSNSVPFVIGSGSTGSLTVTCNPSNGPTSLSTFFSQTCSVISGTAPFTWTVSGLPTGLTQSAYTGGSSVTISGYPSSAASYYYTVQVTDSSASRQTGSLPVSGTIGSSTYSLTSLQPSSIAVGSNTISLTVFGNGFTTASLVYFNGAQLSTQYVSTTQLNATLPAAYLATAQSATVTVNSSGINTNSLTFTIGQGSGTGNTLTVACNPGVGPATVNTFYSTTCTASGGSQSYTWPTPVGLPAYLSYTPNGSTLTISGTPSSASVYNFTVKVTDTSSPVQTGTLQLAGQTNNPNSGTGSIILTSLSPSSSALNSQAVSLTVNGSGFSTNSQVVFDGFPIVTTFLSGSQLFATIPAGQLTFARGALVSVNTPGSGSSNSLTFTIGTGGTVQISISCNPGVGPASPNAYYTANCAVNGGNGPYNWTISSGSLPSGLTLSPNGALTSINGYNSLNGPYSYTLQVTDSSSPQNTASLVFAGETGPGTGGGSGFSISNLSPSSAPVGSGQVTLTVTGNNFSSSALVYYNGSPLSTTFVNASQLNATIPASNLTAAQNASITVISSGQTSNPLTFTVGTVTSTGISITCNPTTGPSSAGSTYTTFCSATGGKAPYAWTGVSLPFGLAVTNSTTASVSITGSLFSGSYNYTLQVTDSSTPPVTATYPFVGNISGTAPAQITSLSPVSTPSGSGQINLVVTGTGFVSGVTQVQFGNTFVGTTVVSGNQLNATIPANLLTSPGTINVQLSGTASNTVGFFVTAGGASGVSPGSFSFTYGIGGTLPPVQNLSVSNLNGATGFSIVPNGVANGITWLTVNQGSGVIPGTVGVGVSPGSLPLGTYTGNLTLTGFGVGTSVVVPVTLTVTGPPALVPSSTNVTLNGATGSTATKTINVTVSDGTTVLPYNVSSISNNGGNWLSVSPTTGTTPGSFTITANAANLTPSTYSGTVTLVSTGSLASQVAIPVTFIVSIQSGITVSATSLSFTSQVGQNPAGQTVTVTSGNNAAVSYTVLGTTQKGGGWLAATPTGTTPGSISVTINTANLPADTYTGAVTITAPGATNSPVVIPITLTLTTGPTGPTIVPSPPSMTFSYQAGGAVPVSQALSLTSPSGSGTLTYTIASATTTGGNWLSVAPTTGNTPSSVFVSVSPTSLSPGTYSGTLTVTAAGTANLTVPVTLNVASASSPSVVAVPGNLTFFVPGDGSTPAPQSVSIISTGANTSFTASAVSQGGNWLTVTGGGQTPSSLTATVNPAGLSAGQIYNGSITVSAPGSIPSSLQIPVTLNLAQQGTVPLQVVPQSLFLPYSQGAGSDLQHVAVLNTGSGSLSFTAQAQTSSCGNWLTLVTQSGSATASTPGLVAFNVNPSGVTAQTCRAALTVTDGNGKSVNVPVVMAVSGQSQSILLSQTAMNFAAAVNGTAPAPQTFQILNPGSGSMPWSISTQVLSGGNWLSVAPTTGSAQSLAQAGSPINVTVNPQGLAAGVYYGSVVVASTGAANGPQTITVALTVTTAAPPTQVTPAGVIITGAAGVPDSQTATITNLGSSAVSFASAVVTDDGQNWLTASPSIGSVPAGGTTGITLTANLSGVGSGLRHGALRLAFSDGSVQTVDVQLVISGTPSVSSTTVRACGTSNLAMEFLSPSQNFQAPARVAVPLQVLVKDCTGKPLTSSSTGVDVLVGSSDIRLSYIGNGIWASTWTPPAATSAVTLTAGAVSVSGGTTASGVITTTGAATAAPANAPPFVGAVVNAGSFLYPGLVAPGTMVSIFGSGLADGQSQVFSTPFPNTLQGAQFSLRGSPLALFYASDTQVNAVLPIGIGANERDQLIVVRDSTQSVPSDLLVADVDPGAFATNQQGTGQGAILIGGTSQVAAPAGSISGAGPATAGQFVSIFLSGLGTVSNPPADGSPSTAGNPSTTPTTPKVTIGGVPATVSYSGLAPGEVGLYQVNVQVPAGTPTGDSVPVIVSIGNGISNTVTMAVK